MSSVSVLRRTAAPAPPVWSTHPVGDPARAPVEDFIRAVYAKRFGADLMHFAPTLVSLRDDRRVVAAAGYRGAGTGPLFLEAYLQAPIEQVLAASGSTALVRAHVVEVGHLAAVRAGEGLRLMKMLGVHLSSLGFRWVVCTLTEELHHLFGRLGVATTVLGRAEPAALGEDALHWGRYYDHRPTVLAGYLPRALQQLARRDASASAA
jgi:hypothetical protein